MILAADKVLRYSDHYRDLSTDPEVHQAVDVFRNGTAPAIREMRNMLEHFDEYAVNSGILQKKGVVPALDSGLMIMFDDEHGEPFPIRLRFNNIDVVLHDLVAETTECARVLDDAWFRLVAAGPPAGDATTESGDGGGGIVASGVA